MKGTNILDEIETTLSYSNEISYSLFSEIKSKCFHGLIEHYHTKVPRQAAVKLIILLKMLNVESINRYFTSDLSKLVTFGKDVFYSIKNNTKINWRKCLLGQALDCSDRVDHPKSKLESHQVPCLIIDDTDLQKTGKCIEFIGRIFSHVGKGSILGFKSLNLAFWTGHNLLHLDFSLHGELGKRGDQGMRSKEIDARFSKARCKDTPGYKRTEEYSEKKTIITIQMILRALRRGFKAQYILADSWFFNQKLTQLAIEKGVHLISRPKNNNWIYMHKGKAYTIAKLTNKFRSLNSRKTWKNMGLYYGELCVDFKGNPIKLFFYKDKQRGSKWYVIATTNLRIGAKKSYEIYQNRWSIEVSYKELKQHLRFGACQSRDFDGQIADATQCLLAYNYLSSHKAVHQYATIGGLFREISQSCLKPTIMQKFWSKVMKLIKKLARFVNVPIQELRNNLLKKDEFYANIDKLMLAFTAET
jgi:hypothetical protein